jgi:regulator of protease activity HflC (stomatin/prohibitin superfamily)
LDHRLAEAGRAPRGYRVTDPVEAVDRAAAETVATAREAAARAAGQVVTARVEAAADMVPAAMAAARVAPVMISATSTKRDESVSSRGSGND